MRRVAMAGILAGLAALPALAQDVAPFDGLYRASPTTDCTTVGGAGGALQIEDGVMLGAEVQCRMTQPVNVRDMDAQLFDMECEPVAADDAAAAGEEPADDASFTERALVMHAADGGMIMVWNGYAFKYDLCPVDPAEGTVTTSDDLGVTQD